ncbi:AAA family ATPase [Selenomonas ruminantium]|uniref:AAA family ATPase n=1 Tax=Selenomonas ruminantium TaxID=971 RepID=UPI001E5E3573|nr:AAA family ATPase [Selenomonas ruminantium]
MMEQRNSIEKHLADLCRARFPMIYLPTWEEERALKTIFRIGTDTAFIKTARDIFVWRITTGIERIEVETDITAGGKPEKDTSDPMKALDFIQKYNKPAMLILLDFHVYFDSRKPEAKVIRKVRDTVNMLKGGMVPKNVILLSPRLILPNELQKDITIVDFDLPDYRDIKQSLKRIINDNRGNTKIRFDLDENSSEELARAAQGLTLQEAENAFARAIVERGCLDKDSRDIIVEEKRQIIKKTGVLEYIQSDLNLDDVGGLGNLKKWLLKRNNSWQARAAKYSLPAPKGVLITGVPGCGKSLTAKAISAMWKLPLLRMDVGKIFSGIVGSSEENMRNAIKTAEAAAPSILWIDEIEKGFSGVSGSGDSGTSTRVFGTFLTWMQEKKEPVFVVATANNIHALPSEMMRKGRFDEIFFVDLPTAAERKAIFKVHLMRRLKDKDVRGSFDWDETALNHLADETEGFVGAEIENAVTSGLFEAFCENRAIRMEDFDKAITNTVPLVVTQAEQISAIRAWANVRAVAATAPEDRQDYVRDNSAAGNGNGEPEKKEDVFQQRGGRTIDI